MNNTEQYLVEVAIHIKPQLHLQPQQTMATISKVGVMAIPTIHVVLW